MISLSSKIIQIQNNFSLKQNANKPSPINFGAKLSSLNSDIFESSKHPQDLLTMSSEEINKILFNAKDINNKLGRGSEGEVYSIPDTDYCVKFPHYSKQAFSTWTKDLTEQEKLNHIVAKSDNGTVIMKRIKGTPLPFNPHSKPTELYELPLDSYKKYIIQLINAYNANLVCDAAPANVIFDKELKTITQIDFQDRKTHFNDENKSFEWAFACLRNFNFHDDRKLALKLFQIALDELKSDSPKGIKAEDIFVQKIHTKLAETQKDILPKQYKFLVNSINEAKDLKLQYLKSPNDDIKTKFNIKIKIAQSLINQLNRGEY